MQWVDPDTHGWVYKPKDAKDWASLPADVGGGPGFAAVADVARRNRCRTVVVENRYVDADYRSDFSSFWSKRFDSLAPFARRVHFFRADLRPDLLHRLPKRHGYLGYSVLRPGPHPDGHIGRTVLAPPPRLRGATLALIDDEVSLFGNLLKVRGAPFVEQDGEFLRCAHAAIWGCHYTAVKRGLVGRQLTADLVDLAPRLLSADRALPSRGLKLEEIQAIFAATGQPALRYRIDQLPEVPGVEIPSPKFDSNGQLLAAGLWNTRLFSVICRYLNSGFPVLVTNASHGFNLVGWFRQEGRIRFVACDDQRGPYEVIDSPFTDVRAPWLSIMVPLPPKVFMSGETAEIWGRQQFRALGLQTGAPQSWKELADKLTATPKEVSLRTFLREGRAFKAGLVTQKRADAAVEALRLARLPHYVWVVEAHDRQRRDAGEPSVIAEVLFDPHSSDHPFRQPRLDSITMPGSIFVLPPDGGKVVSAAITDDSWQSQLPN